MLFVIADADIVPKPFNCHLLHPMEEDLDHGDDSWSIFEYTWAHFSLLFTKKINDLSLLLR
jgi:hypothetical protein